MNLDLEKTCLVIVSALVFISIVTIFAYIFDERGKLKSLIFKTLIFTVMCWMALTAMLIIISASKMHITDEEVLQTYEIENVSTTGLVFDGKMHVIGDNIQLNCEENKKKNVVEKIQRTYYTQFGNIRLYNDAIVYAAYLEDEMYNMIMSPNLILETEK